MDLSFIIIDDTELDHFIAKKMINHADKAFEVKSFYEAQSALNYIKEERSIIKSDAITLILLDIYMPIISGYQFLDAFEALDPAVQDKYYVVALTSSHEPADMNRMSAYKSAKGILSKPLLAEDLSAVIMRMITEKDIDMQ
ncbi:response regulator [Mucilaginibacter calamicampi]|uniref:Response regulator n=1 Tax=Mucilaginibacter calamicampi TaxID=1302352 RepID=A0ABW2Z240_9SPHI